MREARIAAYVSSGGPNTVRVTPCAPWTEDGLERLARAVRGKSPDAVYHVYETRHGARGLKRHGDIVATWHVGEGFEHSEGWWVE